MGLWGPGDEYSLVYLYILIQMFIPGPVTEPC